MMAEKIYNIRNMDEKHILGASWRSKRAGVPVAEWWARAYELKVAEEDAFRNETPDNVRKPKGKSY